jgi:iduronate 2-sulfatase
MGPATAVPTDDASPGATTSSPATTQPLAAEGTGGASGTTSQAGNKKRNVLFIVIDDLRAELGVYGGQAISPTLDRLAIEGIRFDRAYSPISICNPARSAILTGKHPDTTLVYNNDVHFRETLPDVVTLPQHFKQSGYHTEYYGKVFHARKRDAPSWNAGELLGLTEWNLEHNKALNAVEGQRGPAYEQADVPDEAYPEGRVTREGLLALERLAGSDKPFFLALGYIKPHLPFNAPSRYWDLYDPSAIELTEQAQRAKAQPRFAINNSSEIKNYHGIPKNIDHMTKTQARRLVHGYLACISYVDAQVDKVLKKLNELGLAESTAVIVWGDHGFKLGDQASWGKQTNFEIDTRVPLIFRVPWLPAKGVVSQSVGLLDLYPTLSDLFGLKRPTGLHGDSFLAALEDPTSDDGRVTLSQIRRGGVMGYSIRSGKFRYTRWQRGEAVVAEELYDHSGGTASRANLAGRRDLAEEVQRLSARLDDKIAEGR